MIIEQRNPDQIILEISPQNSDGTVKTALNSATVRVYHIASGAEVEDLASQNLVHIPASYAWRYIWEPVTLSCDYYIAEYLLTDTDGITSIFLEDIIVRIGADQALVDYDPSTSAEVQSVGIDISFLKQYISGNWKIVNNQMIFYDSDGVTPLRTYNLFKKDGTPGDVDTYERKKV